MLANYLLAHSFGWHRGRRRLSGASRASSWHRTAPPKRTSLSPLRAGWWTTYSPLVSERTRGCVCVRVCGSIACVCACVCARACVCMRASVRVCAWVGGWMSCADWWWWWLQRCRTMQYQRSNVRTVSFIACSSQRILLFPSALDQKIEPSHYWGDVATHCYTVPCLSSPHLSAYICRRIHLGTLPLCSGRRSRSVSHDCAACPPSPPPKAVPLCSSHKRCLLIRQCFPVTPAPTSCAARDFVISPSTTLVKCPT